VKCENFYLLRRELLTPANKVRDGKADKKKSLRGKPSTKPVVVPQSPVPIPIPETPEISSGKAELAEVILTLAPVNSILYK